MPAGKDVEDDPTPLSVMMMRMMMLMMLRKSSQIQRKGLLLRFWRSRGAIIHKSVLDFSKLQLYNAGNIASVTMLKMTGRVGMNSIMEVKMIWRL